MEALADTWRCSTSEELAGSCCDGTGNFETGLKRCLRHLGTQRKLVLRTEEQEIRSAGTGGEALPGPVSLWFTLGFAAQLAHSMTQESEAPNTFALLTRRHRRWRLVDDPSITSTRNRAQNGMMFWKTCLRHWMRPCIIDVLSSTMGGVRASPSNHHFVRVCWHGMFLSA